MCNLSTSYARLCKCQPAALVVILLKIVRLPDNHGCCAINFVHVKFSEKKQTQIVLISYNCSYYVGGLNTP